MFATTRITAVGTAFMSMCAISAFTACFVDTESPLPAEFGVCTDDQNTPPVIDRPVTYYGDVKPIIDGKCATCHRQGDIGPFPLETYDDAFFNQASMRAAILGGTMPPWQPDECCNNYLWDRSLSPDDYALLMAWFEQGAVAGDPNDPADPIDVDNGGLSRVDLTVTMPEPFTPQPIIGRDEIRCFLIDWPIDEEIFVTGLNVVPGNRSMVHHVILYTVDNSQLDAIRALEAEDTRPGWDCYGTFGADERPTGSLGGWTPGSRGVEFPDGLGRKVPAGSSLVLNVHYDTGTVIDEDQTSIEFMLADQVVDELQSIGVANPLWLIEDGMSIAADDPDAWVFFSYDPTVLFSGRKPFMLYAVNVHMHELGSVGRLAVLRADGSVECLVNINAWDFNWLGDYYLKEPVEIRPGDKIYLECHWDNTAGNQKIVDGEQQAPRDIAWGTDEEMCAAVLIVRKAGA